MPTVAQNNNPTLPKPHESSVLRSPRDSDDSRKQWKRQAAVTDSHRQAMEAVAQVTRTVEKMRRRILGGGSGAVSGWHFGDKIELPTLAEISDFEAQTVIHIQPTHDIVATGIRDAADPTGALVKSCAGLWVSTQYVPAPTTVSGNLVWNLPQFPMPVPTNFDDETNFWIYLGEVESC